MAIRLTIEITGETSEEVETQLEGLRFPGAGLAGGETLDAQVEGKKGPGRGRKAAAATVTTIGTPAGDLDFTKDILPHAQTLAKTKGLKAAQDLAVKHGASQVDPRASQVPKSAHPAYLADLKAALEPAPAAPTSTADLV